MRKVLLLIQIKREFIKMHVLIVEDDPIVADVLGMT